jgi:hypothetical protein
MRYLIGTRGIAKGFQVITAHSRKDEEADIDYSLLTDETITCFIYFSPFKVSRPVSPGPAPTNTTFPVFSLMIFLIIFLLNYYD